MEPSEMALEEIARLIKSGNTSGLLQSEDGENVSWNLSTEIWHDNK